ncbi:unnamed protein product [Adineta steineri]|uniref:G-protein coupled receptors family 1 profile domain-containing protein n=1 Tax=Adineta steineri TaxID=433720 RepID=A0A814E3F1_9BILA|nr:unnamed protein product [Adineta steineri]CAF1569295.1 unnamed protein product [Adineta steineri]
MSYDENDSLSISILNGTTNATNPTQAVLIAFQIGRTISCLCIVGGILGNITLIFTISRSSFLYFPYGLLLLFISTFDIIRLISTIIYYLLQGNIIPLTLSTLTIYVTLYRYPKNVTNWLKVFLAIERFIAVKYWIKNRYNIHSNHAKTLNRLRQRKLLLIILILLLCSLISQHPNLIPYRFISTRIDPLRLLIVNKPNPNFYYANHLFNGILFTIISYIILDDLLPIIILIICNTCLLYQIRRLPTITSKKLADSIYILFFLTIFSIFIIPRSFLVVFNLYTNPEYINDTIISVVFHSFQGLEMINSAITGYTCFLSCRALRKDLIRNLQIIFHRNNNVLKSSIIELKTVSQERS